VRPEHLHERVTAKLFVGKATLKQPNDFGQTRVEVEFFGFPERLGLSAQQELRHRIARKAGDVFSLRRHKFEPPQVILAEKTAL
jgi:hypothetical protein